MSEQLPEPPAAFDALRDGDIRTLPAGAAIARVYFTAGDHPTTWRQMRSHGPTRGRFDHHPPPGRGHGDDGPQISYWAASASLTPTPSNPLCAALAEVFAATRTVELSRAGPWFVVVELTRPLRLLDVCDSTWVVRNHGNAAISSGQRNVARAWARQIHQTYDVDGIWYQTSNCPPARSIALNERARSALPDTPAGSWPLDHPGLRSRIDAAADAIGYQVI